jgi:hypothetical protein
MSCGIASNQDSFSHMRQRLVVDHRPLVDARPPHRYATRTVFHEGELSSHSAGATGPIAGDRFMPRCVNEKRSQRGTQHDKTDLPS